MIGIVVLDVLIFYLMEGFFSWWGVRGARDPMDCVWIDCNARAAMRLNRNCLLNNGCDEIESDVVSLFFSGFSV